MSSFLGLRLRLGGGDEVHAPSRMTRAPLLCLSGADGGSCLTVLDVDADDRDADLAREISSSFRAHFFRPESPSKPRKAGDGLGPPDG
jgi:hypothetical protein